MDEIFLFANPISGRGRGRTIARALGEALREGGFGVRAFFDAPGGIELGRLQARAKPQAAVVIGGDGTVRAVVDRLIEAFVAPPPVAVIPLGTANLMKKHLALGWKNNASSAAKIVAAVRRPYVRHVDAGRANGKLFLLMAGVGIDGQVVHELAAVRRGPIDYLSYVVPAALALGRYAYPPIRVWIDGRSRFGPRPGIAFVGNVAEYGTGFPILPHARSDDGLLDVCVLPCASRADALHLLLKAAAGEHLDVEGVLYATAKNVRIESSEEVPIQIDGDAAGHTPLTIELLDQKIPFIVG